MTTRSSTPETAHSTKDDLTDGEAAALMALLEQVQRARADQREALIWLSEHADTGSR
jgi:hypothetical protein